MSRNRIIYNVLALYAGKNNATGSHSNPGDIVQLTRVQSFDEDFSRTLTNVDQYGNLAAIDRIEIEAPTVKANFSYFLTDGGNENAMGLKVTKGSEPLVSCISGYLTKQTDQKNYFLLISDEGRDASNYSQPNTGVLGIGNGFLTSYGIEAAVGEIPKATVELEALNVRIYSSVDGTDDVPAVNPVLGTAIEGVPFVLPQAKTSSSASEVSALQPGDITLDIDGLIGVDTSDLKIQSFNMSVPMTRQPIRRLGSKFAFTREIQFPVSATFSIDAELGDLQAGNLADVLCDTGKYNISVGFRKPDCGGNGPLSLAYQFRGAKLLNQKITTAIGSNAKFTAEFEAQIGAPEDNVNGVFISGSFV